MSNTFTHIYVELDGVMTRYPYALFASQFVQYVPEPASPLTEGTQGLFSASDWDLKNGGESISSSAFVYSNNAWRKIPTYTTNWDDIEPSVDEEGAISYLRFLPVHKVIELSDIEKQNVKTSIDVNKATQDNLGLVKGSVASDTYGSITVQEDGSITSDLATTIFAGTVILDNAELPVESITNKVYTKEAIDALLVNRGEYPVASKLEKGVIFVGNNLSITDDGVLSVPTAAVQTDELTLGVVKYAPDNFKLDLSESDLEENSFVLSLAQIRALIAYYIEQINTNQGLAIAGKDILGGIKVDPSSTSLYYITEGLLDVKQASTSNYGSVKFLSSDLYDSISSNVTAIPTAYNIVKYVNSKLTGDGGTIDPSKLPSATVNSLGAIKVGASLSISNGVLNVPTAVSNTNNTIAGIVTLTQDIEHNISKALVPTTYAVDAYITAKLSTLSTDNELVPSASSSRAGIVYVQNASNETASSGVYKVPTVGYLTSVINNLTNYIPTATATTPGIVSVLYGDDESQSSPFAPKVPTVNYVNSQIAEAINNVLEEGGDSGGGYSSYTPKYLAWLVIGTASFTLRQVNLALLQFNGVLGYGGLSVTAFISNSVSKVLAQGINIFVFNKELSAPEINSFLYYFFDETVEEGEMQGSGSGGEEGVDNNFVILPASGTFGNYVGVNY